MPGERQFRAAVESDPGAEDPTLPRQPGVQESTAPRGAERAVEDLSRGPDPVRDASRRGPGARALSQPSAEQTRRRRFRNAVDEQERLGRENVPATNTQSENPVTQYANSLVERGRENVSPLASLGLDDSNYDRAAAGDRAMFDRAQRGNLGATVYQGGEYIQLASQDAGGAIAGGVETFGSAFVEAPETISQSAVDAAGIDYDVPDPVLERVYETEVGRSGATVGDQTSSFVGGAAAFPGLIAGGVAQAGAAGAASAQMNVDAAAGGLGEYEEFATQSFEDFASTSTTAAEQTTVGFARDRPVEAALVGATPFVLSGGSSRVSGAATRARAGASRVRSVLEAPEPSSRTRAMDIPQFDTRAQGRLTGRSKGSGSQRGSGSGEQVRISDRPTSPDFDPRVFESSGGRRSGARSQGLDVEVGASGRGPRGQSSGFAERVRAYNEVERGVPQVDLRTAVTWEAARDAGLPTEPRVVTGADVGGPSVSAGPLSLLNTDTSSVESIANAEPQRPPGVVEQVRQRQQTRGPGTTERSTPPTEAEILMEEASRSSFDVDDTLQRRDEDTSLDPERTTSDIQQLLEEALDRDTAVDQPTDLPDPTQDSVGDQTGGQRDRPGERTRPPGERDRPTPRYEPPTETPDTTTTVIEEPGLKPPTEPPIQTPTPTTTTEQTPAQPPNDPNRPPNRQQQRPPRPPRPPMLDLPDGAGGSQVPPSRRPFEVNIRNPFASSSEVLGLGAATSSFAGSSTSRTPASAATDPMAGMSASGGSQTAAERAFTTEFDAFDGGFGRSFGGRSYGADAGTGAFDPDYADVSSTFGVGGDASMFDADAFDPAAGGSFGPSPAASAGWGGGTDFSLFGDGGFDGGDMGLGSALGRTKRRRRSRSAVDAFGAEFDVSGGFNDLGALEPTDEDDLLAGF